MIPPPCPCTIISPPLRKVAKKMAFRKKPVSCLKLTRKRLLYIYAKLRKEYTMITVTELAQEKIGQVLKENKNEEKGVRVFLYGGG